SQPRANRGTGIRCWGSTCTAPSKGDETMAFEQDPNDQATEAAMRRRERLERELQPDPELEEGPASGGRIALFAIAALAILGVVLYGLNSTSTDTASNPPGQTTANSSSTTPPATMPNSPNTRPGQTTGSSMTSQPAPPAAAPSPGGN